MKKPILLLCALSLSGAVFGECEGVALDALVLMEGRIEDSLNDALDDLISFTDDVQTEAQAELVAEVTRDLFDVELSTLVYNSAINGAVMMAIGLQECPGTESRDVTERILRILELRIEQIMGNTSSRQENQE